MNIKAMKSFLLVALIEGLLALIWVAVMPAPLNRGRTLPHPLMQGVAATMLGVLILLGGLVLLRFNRYHDWGAHVLRTFDGWLTQPGRLFIVKDFIVIVLIFAIEWSLLTYLSIPVAFQPVLFWIALVCAQAWLLLLRTYRDLFRSRPGGLASLHARWRALDPEQRRTAGILLVIALIYFSGFAVINWHGISENAATFFSSSGDEVVIYPVATKMVSPAPDLAGQVYRFLIHEDYHYGYPFFYFNALVLAGSRLAFGPDFINRTQINLFLLRQFVSVLPLILALMLLVYLVTHFRSTLYSAIMFIVLLLIPGLIRYNQQFWHPDALQLLFIVLTFYYLQRDQFRFGRDFYYAAVMCGLAAATKLYGFFFFLTIAVYLLSGLLRNILNTRRMIQAAAGFLLALAITLLYASPFLLVPSAQKSLAGIMTEKTTVLAEGDNIPDPEGVYVKGLGNWLRYFDYYYGHPVFFFFSFGVLIVGSFWGRHKELNRLLLTWSLVLAIALIYFVAVKPFHYMIPLALPLYAGVFTLPGLLDEPALARFMTGSAARWVGWGLLVLVVGGQFAINLWDIFTSPYIRVAF